MCVNRAHTEVPPTGRLGGPLVATHVQQVEDGLRSQLHVRAGRCARVRGRAENKVHVLVELH